MSTVYSIYEINPGPRCGLGSCVCDGYDRTEVIESAERYYRDRADDDGNYGAGEEDVFLVTADDEGNEKIEEVTLRWCVERPSCRMSDERFDYLAAIGAL